MNKWGDVSGINSESRPPVEVPKFIPFLVRPVYRDKEFLQQKYVTERLSTREISKLILSSRSVVMKYLKEYAIPLRPADQKTKSQVGFGEVWRDRKVVAHKKELDLIAKMQRLRAEGLSYWKVADVLNAWGIPTKTRKGKWSAKQVHQILRRIERVTGSSA